MYFPLTLFNTQHFGKHDELWQDRLLILNFEIIKACTLQYFHWLQFKL